MPEIFFFCGREDMGSGDPLAKRSPTLPRPQLSDLIARDIHPINTKLHLERENKKGEKEALQTVSHHQSDAQSHPLEMASG